ncbi:SAV_915 family protein [Actinomadura kijaniata]|uniref:SAV_915 family protein n=1 Tax=Actinomadura kijaniata TaxID=46161 RepID=UPI003F19C3EB
MRTMDCLLVPVRPGTQTVSLRTARLPTGERTGIAFTTVDRLTEIMGPAQPWIRLDERAMKSMLAPLGIRRIQVDPGLLAPSPDVRPLGGASGVTRPSHRRAPRRPERRARRRPATASRSPASPG